MTFNLHSGALVDRAKGHTRLRHYIFSLLHPQDVNVYCQTEVVTNKYQVDTNGVFFKLFNLTHSFFSNREGNQYQNTEDACQSPAFQVLDFLSDKHNKPSNSTRICLAFILSN
jgi:hypothetical protein